MALFRKVGDKLARTFDPSNKARKVIPDRVIQDMEAFQELVTQCSNRIEAIKMTSIPEELKQKFIAAEYSKLGYSFDSITKLK